MSKPLVPVSELPVLQIVEVPAAPSAREIENAFQKQHGGLSIDEMFKAPRMPGKA